MPNPVMEETRPIWPVIDLDERERAWVRQVLYRPSPPTPELLLRVPAGLRRL